MTQYSRSTRSGPLRVLRADLSARSQGAVMDGTGVRSVEALRDLLATKEDALQYLLECPTVGEKMAKETLAYLYGPEAYQRLVLEQRRNVYRRRMNYYAKLSQDAEKQMVEIEAELKQQEDNQ